MECGDIFTIDNKFFFQLKKIVCAYNGTRRTRRNKKRVIIKYSFKMFMHGISEMSFSIKSKLIDPCMKIYFLVKCDLRTEPYVEIWRPWQKIMSPSPVPDKW